jgi:hypothetical protein
MGSDHWKKILVVIVSLGLNMKTIAANLPPEDSRPAWFLDSRDIIILGRTSPPA